MDNKEPIVATCGDCAKRLSHNKSWEYKYVEGTSAAICEKCFKIRLTKESAELHRHLKFLYLKAKETADAFEEILFSQTADKRLSEGQKKIPHSEAWPEITPPITTIPPSQSKKEPLK